MEKEKIPYPEANPDQSREGYLGSFEHDLNAMRINIKQIPSMEKIREFQNRLLELSLDVAEEAEKDSK